ncbi:MAG TPA: hypothetical protein VN429_00675, partial [Methanospirillum sp.]|uniref:hypothetical protein n=1 Tax=Methanospirillum sp. TaxID=45200 RepID=UPI002B8BE434
MKVAGAILIIVLVIVGCLVFTVAAETNVTTTVSTPDLVGIWNGTAVGHTKVDGFAEFDSVTYNITEQKGQALTGVKEYLKKDGKLYNESFSGIVDDDGTIYLVDSVAGVIIGRMNKDNELKLKYFEDGPDTKALIIT